MTAALLLLGALLAQGHGAKASVRHGARRRRQEDGAAPERRRRAAGQSTDGPPATADAERRRASGGSREAAERRRGGQERVGPRRGGGSGAKPSKSKTYNFGAMDVEGKLKTPQLLYFLNRVKLELDMSAPDTRSFMKELEKSADDKNFR